MKISILVIVSILTAALYGDSIKYLDSYDDFTTFVGDVNSGTSYEGTTVFLTTDVDLSGVGINPIGYHCGVSFLGTFDGLGHTIGRINTISENQMVGLFGCSASHSDESLGGATIRNLVIGGTSSLSGSYSDDEYSAFAGGILAYSISRNNPTKIENCVNMASITHTGEYRTYIGGIIGYYEATNNPTIVRNCANYGDVTSSAATLFLGGIVGIGHGVYDSMIINNINYGTLIATSTSPSQMTIGGIFGFSSYYNTIMLCVSAGKIETTNSTYTHSIIGFYNYANAAIRYNFYSDQVGYTQSGYNYEYSSDDLTLTASGESLASSLNGLASHYAEYELSPWLENPSNNEVTFMANEVDYLALTSSVILIPNLMNNYIHFFDGWYTDSEKETLFSDYSVTGVTTLYATFNEDPDIKFTVKLVSNGATVGTYEGTYGGYIDLPMDMTKDNCVFLGWVDEDNAYVSQHFRVPWYNVTLYAKWKSDKIITADDFIEFVNNVSSGATYEGETVFLGDDIDMSGVASLSPISSNFKGTFNGQGHVIKNITVSSTSRDLGLFGVSYTSTIMNVVLDDSCTFTSSFSDSDYSSILGGIGGRFYARDGPIDVKNCVVMATIQFTGSASEVHIGGIIGQTTSYNYDVDIKNCAFLGVCADFGLHTSVLGGIIGLSVYASVENCLSNGFLKSEATTYTYIGGIVGYNSSSHTYINNCVAIENHNVYAYYGSRYGHIIGNTEYTKGVNFWHGSLKSGDDGYGFDEYLIVSKDLDLGYYSGYDLIDALNNYRKQDPYLELSPWVGNTENHQVKFLINGNEAISTTNKVILMPSLANNPKLWFNGWYDSEDKSALFEGSIVSNDIDLYGTYTIGNDNRYYVSFVSEGETLFTYEAGYGDTIKLPTNVTKERYAFLGWTNAKGESVGSTYTVSTYNISLYAGWIVVNIRTSEEFKEFRSNVNTGISTYSSLTVTLENDLVFPESELQEPIGTDSYSFYGTFDGKGHVISNFIVDTTSSQYSGLFGVKYLGSVINVVLDGSCHIKIDTSSLEFTEAYIGSIIGYAYSSLGDVSIQDCLNMGAVTFSGGTSTGKTICIGGIVGKAFKDDKNLDITRCANYGPISSHTQGGTIYLGGIVGDTSKSSGSTFPMLKCLNNGLIKDTSNKATFKIIGGIIGYNRGAGLSYSVSYGQISVIYADDADVHPVVGSTSVNTFTGNFYFNSTNYKDQGITPYSFEEDFLYSGSTVANVLNAYARDNVPWSVATFFRNGAQFSTADSSETVKETYLTLCNHVPPLIRSDRTFLGWFTNDSYTEAITNANSFTETITLYAGFGHRIKAWNGEDLLVDTLIDEGKRIDIFPDISKECYYLDHWKPVGDTLTTDEEGFYLMPNHDVEFVPVWSINEHTANFMGNYSEGIILLKATTINCGSTLDPSSYTPNAPSGYSFKGWSLNVRCSKIESTLINVTSDKTLYACWEKDILSSSSSTVQEWNRPEKDKASKKESSGLSGGAIFGIVIASFFVVSLISAGAILFWLRDSLEFAASGNTNNGMELNSLRR